MRGSYASTSRDDSAPSTSVIAATFVSEDEVHAAADIVCFTALNEAYL
jgi:hypothetical protein